MVDREAPGMDVLLTNMPRNRTREALKRNTVLLISQNVCGLKSDDRLQELTQAMKTFRLCNIRVNS